jgi:uncharacterized membrane protein YccC
MKNSSTSRFFLPTVVGFMLGLLFLYLFLLPMPDVFEKSFGWLYFPAFFLCFACFGHYPHPGDKDTALFCFIVLQWLLLGLLIGICWFYFGRTQNKPSA